jgi:hypothetical protein
VFNENFEEVPDFEGDPSVMPAIRCINAELLDELKGVLDNEY